MINMKLVIRSIKRRCHAWQVDNTMTAALKYEKLKTTKKFNRASNFARQALN